MTDSNSSPNDPSPSAPSPGDEELLLDLATGFLEPPAAAELEARLEVEPELRARYEELQAEQEVLTAALGSEAGFEEVPAGLEERVLARVDASQAVPTATQPGSGPKVLVGGAGRRPGSARRWALLAAAALVTAGLVALNASPRQAPAQRAMNHHVRTSELLALGILPEAPQ